MIRRATNDKNILNRGGKKFEKFYSFFGNINNHIIPDIIISYVVY